MAKDETCLFCRIVAREEPGVVVWENEEFVAIENKYPVAPIHLLVMPKDHVSKMELASALLRQGYGRAEMTNSHFWDKIMAAVFEVVRLKGLDKTGYKLVNNGGGYNHFDHEHIHVLGGTREEPAGTT
ncbi:HIT domain-containing protein [Candidatus Collierbacteria bacterium]|nr:HIT domain-containing protein [Candidatus Collierbacteria bacterium]